MCLTYLGSLFEFKLYLPVIRYRIHTQTDANLSNCTYGQSHVVHTRNTPKQFISKKGTNTISVSKLATAENTMFSSFSALFLSIYLRFN